MNGWPEKALLLLPEALRLRPTLIEWSQHDSDLDEVRSDPAFQAIFQDPELVAKAPVSSLACVMVEESTVGFLAAIVLLVTFGYVVTLVYECLSRSAITSVAA